MIKIFGSSKQSYYHYDFREFDVGDIILGNHHNIDDDIALAYNQATKLNDITSIIYMLNHEDNQYSNAYDYGYQVDPIGKILKAQMDYSAILCHEDLQRCLKYYISHNRIDDPELPGVREMYVSLMVESYLGDEDSKDMLETIFGYSRSNNIEYICQSAKVVKILQ